MTRKALGPYARGNVLAHIDGRTRAARTLKATRAGLIKHIGGKPSAVQAAIIERVCQLTVRIGAMDAKYASTGHQTEHDTKSYLAWTGALTRLLARLGMDGVQPRPPTLAEIMAMPRPDRAA